MLHSNIDPETRQRYPYVCSLCKESCQPELQERVHSEGGAPICPSCFDMLSKLRREWTDTVDEGLREFLDRVEQRLRDVASARKRPREHWEEHHRLIDQARVRWEME